MMPSTSSSSLDQVGDEEELAVNIVADQLLPIMGGNNDEDTGAGQKQDVQHRRKELDDEFGTQFSTRLVRDVAPGKVVVCASFYLTPKLIRYMQGDYI